MPTTLYFSSATLEVKKTMTRDNFYERFITRPLSHSQLESFRYNKEEWYNSYILGRKFSPNALMKFGTRVGDAIGTPDCPIGIPTAGVKEFKLDAKLGDIYVVGYADHFCPVEIVLTENKTTDNPNKWTKETVAKHKQLTMYCLMLALTHDIPPEDVTIYLNDIRTERYWTPKPGFENEPDYLLNEHIGDEAVRLKRPLEWNQYETRRTARDLVRYTAYIEKTVERMYDYHLLRERELFTFSP